MAVIAHPGVQLYTFDGPLIFWIEFFCRCFLPAITVMFEPARLPAKKPVLVDLELMRLQHRELYLNRSVPIVSEAISEEHRLLAE